MHILHEFSQTQEWMSELYISKDNKKIWYYHPGYQQEGLNHAILILWQGPVPGNFAKWDGVSFSHLLWCIPQWYSSKLKKAKSSYVHKGD